MMVEAIDLRMIEKRNPFVKKTVKKEFFPLESASSLSHLSGPSISEAAGKQKLFTNLYSKVRSIMHTSKGEGIMLTCRFLITLI